VAKVAEVSPDTPIEASPVETGVERDALALAERL